MNILQALSQLEVTGAEVYATTLADELIKKENNVYIVSDTLTKPTKAEYEKIEFNKRKLKNRISQVKKLLKIIKEKDIQVVHAHSRASSWSSAIACKIAKIPLITTIHGRQPVHLSRKLNKGFGDYSFAVCENIENHIKRDLGVSDSKIKVLRNMIDTDVFKNQYNKKSDDKKIISIIGRLSGPKGDMTYRALEILAKKDDIKVQVIGGKDIPARFEKFKSQVDFLGYINNVNEKIMESSLVIGAGRVAIESLLSKIPVIAIGEAKLVGTITKETFSSGLESNFGDISTTLDTSFEWERLESEIEKALNISYKELEFLKYEAIKEFSIENIVDEIEKVYQREIIKKRKYEIPILMYHRVIKSDEEKGVHGIYVTDSQFDEQMKYLKANGYKTITFEDLLNSNYKKRFDKNNKWVMITFDDGYKDNYTTLYPILKKYNFKCVIYILDEVKYNKWDVDNSKNPEKKFDLMTNQELLELQEYGIEFGGHTSTHPHLPTLSKEEAMKEIKNSKGNLEKILGKELISFAYPYGELTEEVKEMVKEVGYTFAVATDSGSISFADDIFRIRRIGIFPKNKLFNFKRKVSGRYNFIKMKRENKNRDYLGKE